jgi:BirA family biotin operon repressor/biotin-[acetyl-CoA-carboxylase] ligase
MAAAIDLSIFSDLPIDEIRYFDTLDSTNTYAQQWARESDQKIRLVIADMQTAGRGRLNRKWITTPGSSLAMSLILTPEKEEKQLLNLFSPLAGVAAAKSLEENHALHPTVKWPNDILLNNRKMSGILCETVWDGPDLISLVLGIGMNIRNASIPDQVSVRYPTTSLESAGCACLDPIQHCHDITQMILTVRKSLGTPAFIAEWERLLAFKGQIVTLETPGKSAEPFHLEGLAVDGSLIAIDASGVEHRFIAGEISLRLPVDPAIDRI